MLYATLNGLTKCRFCGRTAQLDMLSRWIISCAIALVLPGLLLYGNVFYSGHLFLVSILVIFGGWGILSYIASPVLTLEAVPDSAYIERSKSIAMLAAVLVAAIGFDSFMASRFESEEALENGRSQSAVNRER